MPTPSERRALAFVACVGLLGAGWRIREARANDTTTPPVAELSAQILATDSAAAARAARTSSGAARGAAGAGAGATAEPLIIDVDVAAAVELDRLPRIGPVLAARIVNDREANGPFGSLVELQRVSGVGPKLAESIRPYVTFSGRPRPKDDHPPTRTSPARASGGRATGRPPPRSSRPP